MLSPTSGCRTLQSMARVHRWTAFRVAGVSGFDVLREMTKRGLVVAEVPRPAGDHASPVPPRTTVPSLTRTTPALNQKPPSR